MKITKRQLKRIIQEETAKLLREASPADMSMHDAAEHYKKQNVPSALGMEILSIKDVINKQIDKIHFVFNNLDDLNKLEKLSKKEGKTRVKFSYIAQDKELVFELDDLRNIDYKLINSLNLKENILID